MGLSATDITARLLRQERWLVGGTVVLLAALGWGYLLRSPSMDSMTPPLTALIVMWCLMMIAMMLPSAVPAILLYARVRQVRQPAADIAATWVFFAGYLIVWLSFSILAALAQSFLIGSSMALQSKAAQAGVLIAAGLYQISPLKSACLVQCRSPAQFISRHWRRGAVGALRLGLLHGGYCVGCCWMLMGLLFVGGIMNLLWIIALAIFVAAEKLLPAGLQVQKISAVALVLAGVLRSLDQY